MEPPNGEEAGADPPGVKLPPNPLLLGCEPNAGGWAGNPNDEPVGVALALAFPPNGLGVTLPLLVVEKGLANAA